MNAVIASEAKQSRLWARGFAWIASLSLAMTEKAVVELHSCHS
jgi:hypothetical protein